MYRHDLMLQEAEDDQQELEILINKLNNNYNPKNQTKIKEKERKLFSIREEIIRAFKKGVFPYIDGFQVEKESDEESNEESTLGNEHIDATDMSDLEGEESAVERRNQQAQGLKMLTPNQMLSRLAISLAQLKAGNNSKKLKNEIRQLLYSLCRSKNSQSNSIKVYLALFKTLKQSL